MGRSILRILAMALALAFSGITAAQTDFDTALVAYLRGDYAQAVEQFLLLAHQGRPEAQYYLGQMYENGQGVQQDRDAAVRWYRAAAEQGDADAAMALSRLGVADNRRADESGADGGAAEVPSLATALEAYDRGDYDLAREQLSMLARRGDAEAQYRLGLIHQGTLPGTRRDAAQATQWFRSAAERGHRLAPYHLGQAYERGEGVPQDLAEARRWYEAAAGRGHPEAWLALRRVAAFASLETAIAAYEAADYRTAHAQFAKLANRGDARAQYWLGLLHEKGQGVTPDAAMAAKWYRNAAQRGDADAQFNLAALYERGRGVPQDGDTAYRWYSAARAQGHPQAAAAIGRLLSERSGPIVAAGPSGRAAAMAAYERRDYVWAAEQFRVLGEAGDAEAQYRLGIMYEQGLGVSTNANEARRWYRAAAEQGDPMAQLALARTYSSYFLGAAPVYAEAARWYRAAAAQGNPEAQAALGHLYRDGRGVTADYAESNRWYETARRTSDGVALLTGFSCAAAKDVPELAAVYAPCRRGDHRAALATVTALAEQGSAAAQAWLGFLHYTGLEIPVERNFHKGARWYRAAAERGDATAQYDLGLIYEHGMGVAADRDEARRWYQAAAAQGDARAEAVLQLFAGDLHDGPSAVDGIRSAFARGDDDRALDDLAGLVYRGDAEGQTLLGALYLAGRYFPQDYAQAEAQFRAAAEQDHAVAQYFLGLMHERGLGVAQDGAEAARWYEAAAGQGDLEAEAALERLTE